MWISLGARNTSPPNEIASFLRDSGQNQCLLRDFRARAKVRDYSPLSISPPNCFDFPTTLNKNPLIFRIRAKGREKGRKGESKCVCLVMGRRRRKGSLSQVKVKNSAIKAPLMSGKMGRLLLLLGKPEAER